AVETAAAMEIENGGDFYLMISIAAWKSCRKKRSGFSTVPTALTALSLLNPGNQTQHFFYSLDSRGLATLLRTGTLPEVWSASREVRDHRELLRLRMTLVAMEVRLKNRVHAILGKYAIELNVKDVFSKEGRRLLLGSLKELPVQTAEVVRQQMELLESTEKQRQDAEQQLRTIIKERWDVQLLRTLPGVGWILGTVIAFEIGDIGRFDR